VTARRLALSLVGLLWLVVARAEDAASLHVLPAGAAEPQVAVSPTGKVFVVAAGRDLIAITSSTDGTAFGKPALLARVRGLAVGTRTGPKIVATGSALVVTACGQLDGQDGELLSWRSTDEGLSWRGPVRVNGKPGAAGEGLVGMGSGPKDEVAVAWLDGRSGQPQAYAATSADSGATWREVRVYRSPDGHVCECCHPSVAWTPKGELAVMWRNSISGARDMWLAVSKDGGASFGEAQKLGTGTWSLNRCPTDGGALVAHPDGKLTASWTRADEIFLGSVGKEESLGPGGQSWATLGPGGIFTVWLREKAVLARIPGSAEPRALATKGVNPVVAGSRDGKGPVIATWATDAGVFVQVLAPRAK
jgi:hypothetical protein